MIDIPSNLTDGASVYLGDKQFVYNGGKLVPYTVTNVGTELPSALLNTEILTTERHPISNKPIYKKVINFGSLPNATTKTVAHGITGIDFIMIDFSNSFILVPGVPDASFSGMVVWSGADSVGAYLSSGNIFVYAGNNRTNMVGYFTLKYTKTTDTAESPVRLIGGGGTGGVVDSTKAPLNSPSLTGVPTAPTAAVATNNTQIATTAFVKSVVDSLGSFTESLTQNGWTKLPNGLIIQWTTVIESTTATDYKAFPIAFPNACLSATLQLNSSVNLNVGTVIKIIDNTKFIWTAAGSYGGGGVAYMIAIGY